MSVTSANRLELLQIADAVAREKMIDQAIVIEAMEEASARPRAPATAPRTTSAPSSTASPATSSCGASARWSRSRRTCSSS